MKTKILLFAAIAAGGTLGCGSDQEAGERTPITQDDDRGLAPEFAAALDAGTAHYRAEEYQLALDSYRKATELAPDQPSGWMGVRMAAMALGDSAVADSALARVQELVPSDEMVHPPLNRMPQDSIHGTVERQSSTG